MLRSCVKALYGVLECAIAYYRDYRPAASAFLLRQGDAYCGRGIPSQASICVGELEKTPNVPALDIPGLDVVSTAKGFGCPGVEAKTREEIKEAFSAALKADGPTLIAIPIKRQMRPLIAP